MTPALQCETEVQRDERIRSANRGRCSTFARPSLIWLMVVALLTGCQKNEEPRVELTPAQERQVDEHLLDERPEPEYELGVRFDDEIELIGLDVDDELVAGQEVTFTWYWEVLDDVEQDWRIFGHFDARQGRGRQHLDHYPLEDSINDVYRTYHWREGQLIEDVQTVTLRDDFPGGDAVPYVGLYRGKTRAPITNDAETTADGRAVGPTLEVVNDDESAPGFPDHSLSKLAPGQVDGLELDGRLDEPIWDEIPAIELRPFGGGDLAKTTVRAAYSEDALVVGAHLEDHNIWSTLGERDGDLWTEEVIELFLAPGGPDKPYVELQLNPLETVFDARFKSRPGSSGDREADIEQARSWDLEGLDVGVHIDGEVNDGRRPDKFWSAEMVIPFDGLELDGAPPDSGDRWRVNLYRFDRPDDETTHSWGWSTGPGGDFHQIQKFGHWTFGARL